MRWGFPSAALQSNHRRFGEEAPARGISSLVFRVYWDGRRHRGYTHENRHQRAAFCVEGHG